MDAIDQCNNYLISGGLFNPEFAIHDNVRDMIIDCRDQMVAQKAEVEQLQKIESRYWKFAPKYDNLLVEVEQLREALRFYAEWGIDAPAVDAIIEEDRGDKARAALNEGE